jgi:hypothetical protein
MRGISEQNAPLVQSRIHQPDLPLRQIPDPPMNQFGAPAGSPLGKIGLFQQQDPKSSTRRIYSDSQPRGASPDDDHIPFFYLVKLAKLAGTVKTVILVH